MPRITNGAFGESRLRMLRVVRRGDRHDPHDLTVSCRYEGDFSTAFTEGQRAVLLPGEVLKNVVHAAARQHGGAEIETFGLALCERILAAHPHITRARVDITEQPWSRLEAGGKAQGQAFLAVSPERRTAAVTSNGTQAAVVSGIENLIVMRSSGFRPSRGPGDDDATGTQDGLQRMLVATLAARWTYTSGEITFGSYRQGVRAAIIETLGCHGRRSVPHTLHEIGDVVLASYQEIVEISFAVQERPYRPADLFGAGVENPDDLFVAVEEPLELVELTVER